MTSTEQLALDYRAAFLRYLPGRNEAASAAGYELGRRAAAGDVGLLDVVQVHHRILGELLAEQPPPEPVALTEAAAEFLCEVLSTFDMAHRAVHDAVRRGATG